MIVSSLVFDSRRTVQITPFKIVLQNQLVKSSVTFDVEVQKPKYFDFIGAQCLQWTLEGGQDLVLPMKAVFPSPGVYNLQTIKVTLKNDEDVMDSKDDDGEAAYDFGVQWLINVACADQ
jgi:hypothetical protein